ncbi:MAG TPA: NAD(P)/FAD-dependent oxidoreductase [Chitinophagaceae bacterium]|nr:NAD(P)/FAD-dependent oxidoreductase [Chitinophagaceae bacterium]
MITTTLDGLSINIPDTGKPRVVIIGAGFGGLNTAEKLSSKDFQIVLLDKRNYHTFQPLLYQVATAGLQPDSIAGPLRNAFNYKKDFHFRMLRVLSVNPDTNTISTIAGDLKYDYLVIANGMRTNFFGNDQIEKYALPLKSVPDALNLRSQIMQIMELANMTTDLLVREKIMTIVIAGAGPTGVEIAGALSELRKHVLPKDYPGLDFSEMKIYVIEGADRVLPPMSLKSSARAQRYLEKMGILLKPKALVESYDGQNVTLKDGEKIPTYTVIWSAGVKGDVMQGLKPEWVERGRLLTDEYCKVKGSNNIFAIGDIALMKTDKYPKGHPGVAQPAIQMGKYLGNHLIDFHGQKLVKPFKYFDKGSLATIGRGKAVADLPHNLSFGGRPAWWIWLFIHISFLISFRNKILVMTSWIWNYFTYDKGNRLIIRPYIRKGDVITKQMFVLNETE